MLYQWTSLLMMLSVIFCGVEAAQEIIFQSGRLLRDNEGSDRLYNQQYETSINKLYQATWNQFNGATFFWGYQPTFTINEKDSDVKYRMLIRFDDLHAYIPAESMNVTVLESDITLTFVNSKAPVLMEACFITLPWDFDYEDHVRPKYLGTGWKFHRYNASAVSGVNASLPWTEDGAWADCDPRANMTFTIPGDNAYHNITKTFHIDPGLVGEWLEDGGARNYGVLLRAAEGSVAMMGSAGAEIHAGQKAALRIKYSSNADGGGAVEESYPVTYTNAPRVIWVDAAAGNDVTGSGSSLYPYASPAKALFEAWPGDVINMRSGVYPGALYIRRSNVTLQSAPGHWAVIASSMHDPASVVNAISVSADVENLVLRGFEVTGGFYYGIMLSFGSGRAPGNVLIENLRVHHTGTSCIKASQSAFNVTIRGCEIYSCGVRYVRNAHAFVGVQTHNLTIEDSYIHDLVGGAGVHLEGGSIHSLIQRNFLSNVTFGMNVGFASAYGSFDVSSNPELYESINSTIVNNIITGARFAGINLWAALDATVAFNTLFHSQEEAQSNIVINSYRHLDAPGSPIAACKNISVVGNIFQKSSTAYGTNGGGFGAAMLHIRDGGLVGTEMPLMSHNVYHAASPTEASDAYATFLDERSLSMNADSVFFGGLESWTAHCDCDEGSVDGNPLLQSDFSVAPCSPAAFMSLSGLLGRFPIDFHGHSRIATSDHMVIAGAVSSDSASGGKSLPPVPEAFSAVSPFSGSGSRETLYDFGNWPYLFWQNRECKDLHVDAVLGNDAQGYNLDSAYSEPFKTAQAAHSGANPCDRILLKGGQDHAGPLYLGRTNITVTTDPDDLAAGLQPAFLMCNDLESENCIHAEGNVGGKQAVHLTLTDFNIAMTGGGGDCIRMNAGFGGGSLSFWDFYVAGSTTGNYSRGHTLIKNIKLKGCGRNGIKLSTFVTDVLMQDLVIKDVHSNGVVIYGGGNVTVRGCKIRSVGKAGVMMSGGSRQNIIERNVIRLFGERGILLGNRGSLIEYSDVDYANSPSGSWHDAINCTVRNNIIVDGGGPGIAFYSAKDMLIGHNTIVDAGKQMQGGVMLNLSPRILNDGLETLPANENIVFKNNIVSVAPKESHPDKAAPVINMKTVQGSIVLKQTSVSIVPDDLAEDICDSGSSSNEAVSASDSTTSARKLVQSQSFAVAAVNAPGTQGRNPDGSCPHFPDSNLLNMRVDDLPVHPRSDIIKIMIGSRNMHAEFGTGAAINGVYVPYGIPFRTVNTMTPPADSDTNGSFPTQSIVPLDIDDVTGYPSESDFPFQAPFADDAPVQNAYLNCPDEICGGDRHTIIIDNSTCTLYESFRSFPPNVTGGNWSVAGLSKFNLMNNLLRPLGWTSADAAGLPIHSGLVKFDEVINKGEIKHAIRMTGPNSKQAYSLPATHFAPAGDTGIDSPWMGMRVRLKSSFDCSGFARASRVFCVALKTYGAMFADNGASWDFGGEATDEWIPYKDEFHDLTTISPADMEVLDSGCLCLDAECVVADCGDGRIDPTIPPVFPPIDNVQELHFDYNVYRRTGTSSGVCRFRDQRRGSMGTGYSGNLKGWQKHIKGDRHSMELDSHSPLFEDGDGLAVLDRRSEAMKAAPALDFVTEDFHGNKIVYDDGGNVNIGALNYKK